jgi:hypothetical protein
MKRKKNMNYVLREIKGKYLFYQMYERFFRQLDQFYQHPDCDSILAESKVDQMADQAITELPEGPFTNKYCPVLSLQQMACLHKAGLKDLMVTPEIVYLWHRLSHFPPTSQVAEEDYCYLLDFPDGKDFLERYEEQAPLRAAWEESLENKKDLPSGMPTVLDDLAPLNQEYSILRMVAQERLCLRSLLEVRLKLSAATISRATTALINKAWLAEKTTASGPGRPTGLLYLTPQGLEEARRVGLAANPSPDVSNAEIIAERVFYQRIAMVFAKAYPEVELLQAYTDPPVPVIPSPLGNIVPDLIIKIENKPQIFIEAESGKYEYKRLKEKIDKYLASDVQELIVISENQATQTWNHLCQWISDRKKEKIAGISIRPFAIRYTTLDLLQRHGPQENIWRILSLDEGSSTDKTSKQFFVPVPPNENRSQKLHLLAEPLLEKWRSNQFDEKKNGDFIDLTTSIGQSLHISNLEADAVGHLEADWYAHECGETDEEFGAVHTIFLLEPFWDEKRILAYLNKFCQFLEVGARKEMHRTNRYFPLCFSSEFYGLIVLVHTQPGEEGPGELAHKYANWRNALQVFCLQKADQVVCPRIALTHISLLSQANRFDQVTRYSYDLAGYC